jgi:hypothetical protein
MIPALHLEAIRKASREITFLFAKQCQYFHVAHCMNCVPSDDTTSNNVKPWEGGKIRSWFHPECACAMNATSQKVLSLGDANYKKGQLHSSALRVAH